MAENIENEDWRMEAPTLSALPVREAFSVPEGYFDNLSNKISARVYLEELKSVSQEPEFTVPQHYFEQLTNNINTGVMLESLKTTLPDEAYEVPADYFNTSKLAILAKTADGVVKNSPSKVVRLWRSNAFKYASAACFVIVAGLGVYFNGSNSVETTATNSYADVATEQMLFDIDEDVIIEHIQSPTPEAATAPANQAELENYILSNFSSSDLTTDY